MFYHVQYRNGTFCMDVRNTGSYCSTDLPAWVLADAYTMQWALTPFHQHRRAARPPALTARLSGAPLVHLCFIIPLGVIVVVITASSTMKVPFGTVTRLSHLAWVVTLGRRPSWFHPAFHWICTLLCNCGYSRPVAVSLFLNRGKFIIFI